MTKTVCECGSEMTLRSGGFGKFWGCSSYPKCRKTKKHYPGSSVADGPPARKAAKATSPAISLGGMVRPLDNRLLKGSEEQEAIWDTLLNTGSHVAVNAVAGSGKSTTMVQAVLRMVKENKGRKGTIVAFNKHIASEMEGKLPPGCGFDAVTYHGLGFRAIRSAFGKSRPDGWKMHRLAEAAIERAGLGEIKEARKLKQVLTKLCEFCKRNLKDGRDTRWLVDAADEYDLDTKGVEELALPMVAGLMRQSLDDTSIVDFNDMIYMPIVMDLKFPEIDELFVDEFQDTDSAQHQLTMLAAGSTARVTIVGDVDQCIYQFRGSNENSIRDMVGILKGTDRGCVELPLTVTRRCPKSHVRLVQALVPHIKSLDDAPEGKIGFMDEQDAQAAMRPGDMVLCRVNKSLIPTAYELIRRGVKAVVRGRDIGTGLTDLVEKLAPNGIADLLVKLAEYRAAETARLVAKGPKSEGMIQALEDKIECLTNLTSGMSTIPELTQRIRSLFEDFDADGRPNNAVVLSSVHRAKGLEASRVFVLSPELMPHPRSSGDKAEANIAYIAATRAKYGEGEGEGELVWVGKLPELFGDPKWLKDRGKVEENGDEEIEEC